MKPRRAQLRVRVCAPAGAERCRHSVAGQVRGKSSTASKSSAPLDGSPRTRTVPSLSPWHRLVRFFGMLPSHPISSQLLHPDAQGVGNVCALTLRSAAPTRRDAKSADVQVGRREEGTRAQMTTFSGAAKNTGSNFFSPTSASLQAQGNTFPDDKDRSRTRFHLPISPSSRHESGVDWYKEQRART